MDFNVVWDMTNTFEKHYTYARKFSNCWSDEFYTEKYEFSLLWAELKLSEEEGWYLNNTHTVVCNWDETLVNKPYVNEVILTGQNLT